VGLRTTDPLMAMDKDRVTLQAYPGPYTTFLGPKCLIYVTKWQPRLVVTPVNPFQRVR